MLKEECGIKDSKYRIFFIAAACARTRMGIAIRNHNRGHTAGWLSEGASGGHIMAAAAGHNKRN